MSASLVVLQTLCLAARKERSEHNQRLILLIEQELNGLSSLIDTLEPAVQSHYKHHIIALNKLIQKKKEEYVL
jgi:hypothetical protein